MKKSGENEKGVSMNSHANNHCVGQGQGNMSIKEKNVVREQE